MTTEDVVFDHEQIRRHGLGIYEGTPLDVRTVIAEMPTGVKDGFRLGDVPWSRFRHAYGPGADVPELLARLRSPNPEPAGQALLSLWHKVVHQGTVSAVAPLTIPFLVRLAVDPSVHHRVRALECVASAARKEHWGFGTRDTFLLVSPPGERYDCAGYPMHWSIEASRNAVAADRALLLGLVRDPDPEVRAAACYALAASSGEAGAITPTLRACLVGETMPLVRASLVLAVAELGREHGDPGVCAWAHTLQADPAQSPDVRVAAALAFLCLAEAPVGDELRASLDELVTGELAAALKGVPWIDHVDGEDGLARTLDQMMNGTQPGHPWVDPWA